MVANASNGTAIASGNGASPATFSYTPDANFTGNDSFTVRVFDGLLDDNVTFNVTVTPVNDIPVLGNLNG